MPISEESEAEGQDSSVEDDSSETEADDSELICSSSSVPTSWGGQASRGPSIGIPDHAAVAQASVEIAHQQVHFVDVQDGRLALEGVPNVMEQPDEETMEKVEAAEEEEKEEEEEEQDDIGGVTLVAMEGREHGFRGIPSLGLGERTWTTPCPSQPRIEKKNTKFPCLLPHAPDHFVKAWNDLVEEAMFPMVLHPGSWHDADLDVELLYMASEFLSMGVAKGYLGESEDTPSQRSVCRHLMHPS